MGLSFLFAAGLRKKMKRSKVGRNRRALIKPDSRPVGVAVWEFPEDVLMEILARLPANSLMRFKCISKLWYSIISSRYFSNLFRKAPSPLRERRMSMYLVDKDGHGDFALLSASPNYVNAALRFTAKLYREVTIPGLGGCFVNALRGLMCFRIGGRRVRICNLTTKQCVELPLVRSKILEDDDEDANMWNHFGYDPIEDEYKVLSLVWEMTQERVVRSEHQVLVLGPGASWRRITQSVAPHRPCPYSQSYSIDGVLYYGAWNGENTCVVVSFDMRSEEFNLIELPLGAGNTTNLMKYKGQIAVFDYSRIASEGSMDLWVMEESQWSNKKTFALPIYSFFLLLNVQADLFSIHGTSRDGEIRCFVNTSQSHGICDVESGEVIGVLILNELQLRYDTHSLHMHYLDDFESIMYLET